MIKFIFIFKIYLVFYRNNLLTIQILQFEIKIALDIVNQLSII